MGNETWKKIVHWDNLSNLMLQRVRGSVPLQNSWVMSELPHCTEPESPGAQLPRVGLSDFFCNTTQIASTKYGGHWKKCFPMKTHRFVKPVSSHIASHISPRKKGISTHQPQLQHLLDQRIQRMVPSENCAESSATDRSATGPRGPNSSRCMGLNKNRGTSIDNLLLGRYIYI